MGSDDAAQAGRQGDVGGAAESLEQSAPATSSAVAPDAAEGGVQPGPAPGGARDELPRLRFRDGAGSEHSYVLDAGRSVTIGRAPEVDIALSWDPSVSSLHTELLDRRGRWIISDEGVSRNGTFLNGERVSGRKRLRHGDVIRIGQTIVTFDDPHGRHGDTSTIVDPLAVTGTLTFVFTDLAGSTEQMVRLGDDAADRVRQEHFSLLRSVARTHGGREVKSLGDGLMLVFRSALGAVACAVAMQRQVAAGDELADESSTCLRVGLGCGEVSEAGGDYFGIPVVVAKRLCDHATPGQVLVSDLVRLLIGSRGGFQFAPLGPLRLKGLDEPVSAYQLDWTQGTL